MLRTLTQKVALVAGLFLLVVGLAAAVAIPTTFTIREATSHLAAHSLEQFHLNGHFANNVQRSVVESLAYVRTRDTGERAEAEEALADAKVNLAELSAVTSEHEHAVQSAEEQGANVDGDEGIEKDQFDSAFEQKYIDIQRQRITFFAAVEQHVTELLQGVDTGNQATIDRAIAALDELEDQGETLNEAADSLNVENALAASQAVNMQIDRATNVELATFVFFALLVVAVVGALRTLIVKPIKQLSQATGVIASGDLHQTVVVTSNDEVGELQHSFNQMVGHLREQRMLIDNRNQQLEQNLETQQKLLATVQQLSTPLLPVWDGVVVLPLVGHVDTQRADEIMQTLLQGVARQRAHTAILDVTGVAVLDTHVVKLLLQAVQATELLGAKVLLAGITASMAQVVVAQGIHLGDLRTHRDLRSAIEAALGSDVKLAVTGQLQ